MKVTRIQFSNPKQPDFKDMTFWNDEVELDTQDMNEVMDLWFGLAQEFGLMNKVCNAVVEYDCFGGESNFGYEIDESIVKHELAKAFWNWCIGEGCINSYMTDDRE